MNAAAKLPNFSLRFDRGRASLALQAPCALLSDTSVGEGTAFASGIIESLVLDLGTQRGGVRIAGGWTGLRTHRTEITRGTLSLHPSAMEKAGFDAWTFDGVEGDAFRISFRDGEGVFAFDAFPRWRGQDLAVSLRNVRATERRTPTAWSELMGALERRFGAVLDEGTGEFVFHRPLRALLKSTFLRWGMRIPSLEGAILSPPTLITKHAGEPTIRIELQRDAVRAMDTSALVPTAPITLALVRGELANARQALESARPRLDPRLAEELEAAIAIESDAGESKVLLGASLMTHLQTLEAAIRSPSTTTSDLETAVRDWLAWEPSPRFAGALLSHYAEAASPERAGMLSQLALSQVVNAARGGATPERLLELITASILRSDGEVPVDAAGQLLSWLLPRATEDGLETVAVAALYDATGKPGDAELYWQRARQIDHPQAARMVALHEEKRGQGLAALEAWDRAADLAEAAQLSHLVRAAGARGACIAAKLGLGEIAAGRLARALPLSANDASRFAFEVRRSNLIPLALAAEDSLLRHVHEGAFLSASQASESPFLVAALEELLAWSIERAVYERAHQLRAALMSLRPDRADLDALPPRMELAPEPTRKRADRLRSEGKLAEAADALHTLGVEEHDAATLRAALDLAERAGARKTAIAILDTLLAWIPSGSVAENLQRRRAKLV